MLKGSALSFFDNNSDALLFKRSERCGTPAIKIASVPMAIPGKRTRGDPAIYNGLALEQTQFLEIYFSVVEINMQKKRNEDGPFRS